MKTLLSSYLWNVNYKIILLLYHFIFSFVSYTLRYSDASLYWFSNIDHGEINVMSIIGIGNGFMLFVNYPFAVLFKLPIEVGIFLYSILGFYAILQSFKLLKLIVPFPINVLTYDVRYLFLFLPNFHFWTSSIFKEVWCLFFITTIFIYLHRRKFRSFTLWICLIALALLRPHLSLILLISILTAFLLLAKLSQKLKVLYALIALVISFVFYLMICHIININPWSLERWLINNASWRDSFIGSGSYVPIQEYFYPYKYFTFYFRPFFYDVHHPYSWILSIENFLVFGLLLFTIIKLILKRKPLHISILNLSMLFFCIIGPFIYVSRYAGLGIFARTRMMFIPFLIIVLFYIIMVKEKDSFIND